MNLKHRTDPEIRELMLKLSQASVVGDLDGMDACDISESRSLTRKQKKRASELLTKYRYEPSRT